VAKPKALIEAGGIRTLARSIRIVVDDELSDEMRAASKAAAEKIVPYAKGAVPVGATGRLKETIKADATRSRAIIKAGTPSRVPYASAVHRGRYIKSTGQRTKATKYLSSMIPKAWPEMVTEYVEAMDRIAKKFNKKHGVSRVYGRYGSGGK
jgi:hypothetical protein